MRAVIFDLDGTLINSSIDIRGMKESLLEYTHRLGFERCNLTPQNTTVEIVRAVSNYLRENCASDGAVEDVMRELSEIMNVYELKSVDSASPVEGALETLGEVKALGLKIGVLTRGCEEYTVRSLEITGMLRFVDAIEARCDLNLAKPNPASIFNMCSKLDVDPEDVVFVGDHPLDVECAVKANVEMVGIANAPPKEEGLRSQGCATVLRSVSELTPLLKERLKV